MKVQKKAEEQVAPMITQKINSIMGDPSDDEENYLRE